MELSLFFTNEIGVSSIYPERRVYISSHTISCSFFFYPCYVDHGKQNFCLVCNLWKSFEIE